MRDHRLPMIARSFGRMLAHLGPVIALSCSTAELAPQPDPPRYSLGNPPYRSAPVTKVDLLFVVDNSPSMGDKQAILAAAVPYLLDRLTNPVCVDRTTRRPVAQPEPGAPCPDVETQEREFEPVSDIHVGVITSSLGGHGADSCSAAAHDDNPRQQDMSHLLVRGKGPDDTTFHDVATYDDKGFLNWDPKGKDAPAGDANIGSLVQKFAELVLGAGEDGCEFEATLEAWYRFLVDPAPSLRMIPCACFDGDAELRCRCADGIDTLVLQQRVDMIRQDSALVIVMLSDENDCSVVDGGQNYLALQATEGASPFHLARGTEACQSDPWSADCRSCWEDAAAGDPACVSGWGNPDKEDPLNLRCFDQKRRFGVNFLQPVGRYIEGLTERRFPNDTLDPADDDINPVFCTKYVTTADPNDPSSRLIDRTNCEGMSVLRDPSLVFLMGIVGVPWQDIARDPNDLSKGYRTAEELATRVYAIDNPPAGVGSTETLWNVILGETNAAGEIVPTADPLDPLMKESVDARSGTNPITGDVLASPGSNPLANRINGSERDIISRADLQYACTFVLPQPVDCATSPCDCADAPEDPLCFDSSTGTYGTTQYRAKAYPGRRQLAVLKGLKDQAIVTSICPARSDSSQQNAPDWGYRPAIDALVERLAGTLQRSCLDITLEPDDIGAVPCVVIEATKSQDADEGGVVCPRCVGARLEADAVTKASVESDPTYVQNGLNCLCELRQVSDAAQLRSCIHDNTPDPGIKGWCYLDQSQDPDANDVVLSSCPEGQKRMIRFVGQDIPAPAARTFLRCGGTGLPL